MLICLILLMATVTIVFFSWKSSEFMKIDLRANEYHLSTMHNCVRIKEEARHVLLYIYEPLAQDELKKKLIEVDASSLNISFSLIRKRMESIKELQHHYKHKEYENILINAENIMNLLFSIKENVDLTSVADVNQMTELLNQLIIYFEQLQRLHRIAYNELRSDLLSKKLRAPRNILFFLFCLGIIGFLIITRILKTIRLAEEKILKLNNELEQKVIERTKELEDAQESLIRKEKLAVLGQLSGGVAHELRNPLATINNSIYYLKTVLPDIDEKANTHLGIISSSVNNADKIISDLLDFSSNKVSEKENIVFSDLVDRVLEKHPPPEEVKVTNDVDHDLSPLYVDPRQMGQVLINLITNAYQAMPEGGNLTIKAEEGTGNIHISVSDTGCGISIEDRKKIFEPLFTTKAKGIGLGLSVTKSLVEVNDGTIEVESEGAKGSTFNIVLPTKKAQSRA